MAGYQPPFMITNRMVGLVSEIAEKIGRLDRNKSLDMKPHLRRNNRIRSIHSSLAIEANSLPIDAVRGVIDGRTVLGPEKEIQEVKNAYKAYDALGRFDPFSIDELKRLHGIMTYLTVNERGSIPSRRGRRFCRRPVHLYGAARNTRSRSYGRPFFMDEAGKQRGTSPHPFLGFSL